MRYIMVKATDGLYEFAVESRDDLPPLVHFIHYYDHPSAIPTEIPRSEVPEEVWKELLKRV